MEEMGGSCLPSGSETVQSDQPELSFWPWEGAHASQAGFSRHLCEPALQGVLHHSLEPRLFLGADWLGKP